MPIADPAMDGRRDSLSFEEAIPTGTMPPSVTRSQERC